MTHRVRHLLEVLVLLGLLLFTAGAAAQEAARANWPAPPYWSPAVSVRNSPPGDKAEASSDREVLALPTNPLAFTGIAPCRVADTRNASFPAGYGPPFMPGGVPRNFTIWGTCGIPATAEAVSFNFTVVNPGGPGFLKVYPQGGIQPVVSTLNYAAAQTVANAAVVPLGTGGGLTAIPGVSGFDLIIDVNGYYAPGSGLTLPYVGHPSQNGTAFLIEPTSVLTNLTAIKGRATDTANSSWSGKVGVQGLVDTGTGVVGEALTSGVGVFGTSLSGAGVEGNCNFTVGVHGFSRAAGMSGVYGNTDASGVYGVIGRSVDTAGVLGESSSSYGVHGKSTTGDGVFGEASAASKSGVYAVNANPGGYAGFFAGNVHVTGNLSAGGTKPFRIDHPLDPENRELWHAAVESSEVLNVYSGNVVTDSKGRAVVALPAWFEALNADFRYQLTVIGRFARAIVETEIEQNRFTILTDLAGVKVSWQVTARRRDAWMQAHPFAAERDKPEAERGTYLAPLEHGQPEERGTERAARTFFAPRRG